jgi:hypothetical protein
MLHGAAPIADDDPALTTVADWFHLRSASPEPLARTRPSAPADRD